MTTERPIYFDYMATTPVDPHVVETMMHYLGPTDKFGNPGSVTHVYGREAAIAVEHARLQVADTVGAHAEEIIFTSGATEADNLAILGAARFYQRKGRHAVTMKTEHKAVLDSFKQLEREGFRITYLQPGADGLLDLSTLADVLCEDTILVSVMHVNNETGVVQPIEALGDLLRGKGILFHVDAAQSAGKLPIALDQWPVDLMSFSAHKNYGPKGVGALFIRQKPRIRLQALSFGGGHEGGLRSGTLPTHQIVGMGEAFALSETTRIAEQARILSLRQHLWDGIAELPGIRLNGSSVHRIAGTLNMSFSGLDGEALLPALNQIAISTTSACSSASVEPSYVLRAMGVSSALAKSSIRLSLGRFTTREEVEIAIRHFNEAIPLLHQQSEQIHVSR